MTKAITNDEFSNDKIMTNYEIRMTNECSNEECWNDETEAGGAFRVSTIEHSSLSKHSCLIIRNSIIISA